MHAPLTAAAHKALGRQQEVDTPERALLHTRGARGIQVKPVLSLQLGANAMDVGRPRSLATKPYYAGSGSTLHFCKLVGMNVRCGVGCMRQCFKPHAHVLALAAASDTHL